MKTEFTAFLAFVISPLLSFAGYIEDVNHAGMWYEISNGEAKITRIEANPNNVVIPSFLENCPVTRIGAGAFRDKASLVAVSIPQSVTRIGANAFAGCSSLAGVEIPGNVESIGEWAFSGCSSLDRVTIPASTVSIGERAFNGCSALNVIEVAPYNPIYQSINDMLYTKDGFTLIAGVNGNVTIAEHTKKIKSGAFDSRKNLTSVTIPASVMKIEQDAFRGCSAITRFVVAADNPWFRSVRGLLSARKCYCVTAGITGAVDIPTSIISINTYAFSGRRGVTSITLPSSVTRIGERAFERCSDLESVTIPSSVSKISAGAFEACDNLRTIYVEKGDAARVRKMLSTSGFDVTGLQFSEAPFIPKAFGTVAAIYDGYVRNGDEITGLLQVRTAKRRVDGKTGVISSKVTATLQMADGRKISFKNGSLDESGTVTTMNEGGVALSLFVDESGMSGTLGDGAAFQDVVAARNVFSATDVVGKSAAAEAKKYLKPYGLVWNGGLLLVSVNAKGKAKVSGTVNGTKIVTTAQLLVQADGACIPVILNKKVNAAFNLRLGDDMVTLENTLGIPSDAIVGEIGTELGENVDFGKIPADYERFEHGSSEEAMRIRLARKTGEIRGQFNVYSTAKGPSRKIRVLITGLQIGSTGYCTAAIGTSASWRMFIR